MDTLAKSPLKNTKILPTRKKITLKNKKLPQNLKK